MKRVIKKLYSSYKHVGNLNNNGITLIALIITIIVLLILAGITVGALTTNNSILKQSGNAKEKYEIGREKEIISISSASAIGNNKEGLLTEKEFQDAIDVNAGEGVAKVYEDVEDFVIIFDSGRVYTLEKDGDVTNTETDFKNPEKVFLTEVANTSYGTESKPYEINCIEDLLDFSLTVNGITIGDEGFTYKPTNKCNNFSGKNVKLMRNLNFNTGTSYEDPERTDYGDVNRDGVTEKLIKELTTGLGWISIGGYGESNGTGGFKGTFDGNDKTIKRLYINDENRVSSYCGLFGTATNTTIKKLAVEGNIYCKATAVAGIVASSNLQNTTSTISDCTFEGKIENIYSTGRTGGILGYAGASASTMEGCINKGTIIAVGSGDTSGTGGIIASGVASGTKTIRNCINYGEIRGKDRVGGLTGNSTSVYIYNSSNQGKVQGSSGVGGLAGYTAKYIERSFNSGEVISSGSAGGIVGFSYAGSNRKIFQCYNSGTIRGSTAGGIVGSSSATEFLRVEQCYNTGDIIATGDAYAISDTCSSKTRILNCYNTGDVTGNIASGINAGNVGYITSAILSSCYNIGTISGTKKYGVMQPYGNSGVTYNSYYLSTCGANDTIAVSKTSEELKQLAPILDKAFTIDDSANTITFSEGDEKLGVWKADVNNINGGYPILSWQEE